MKAKARPRLPGPLPPPPGPGRFVYGQDPVTGEMSPEPVAVQGTVSVTLNRLDEYLAAYGLCQVRPPFQVGADWILVVQKCG